MGGTSRAVARIEIVITIMFIVTKLDDFNVMIFAAGFDRISAKERMTLKSTGVPKSSKQ
jgi:hypothetical protein